MWPASVSVTLCVERCSSATPSASSIAVILRATVDVDTCISFATAEKLPISTTRTNARIAPR
jgi:hypothetical protein